MTGAVADDPWWPANQVWRPAPGFPDYEVSDQGRVRRATKSRGATVGGVLKPSTTSGNQQVVLYLDGERRYVYVKDLVAAAFRIRGEGRYVMHVEKRLGPLASNLIRVDEEGYRAIIAERAGAGMRRSWLEHRGPLLAQAKKAAELRAGGLTWRAVAKQMGVSEATVYRYKKMLEEG